MTNAILKFEFQAKKKIFMLLKLQNVNRAEDEMYVVFQTTCISRISRNQRLPESG